jgi:hypothetical protein
VPILAAGLVTSGSGSATVLVDHAAEDPSAFDRAIQRDKRWLWHCFRMLLVIFTQPPGWAEFGRAGGSGSAVEVSGRLSGAG